jgi:hypothetical protein
MRRFARSSFPLNLAGLAGGAAARVTIPADSVGRRWSIGARGTSPIRVCLP